MKLIRSLLLLAALFATTATAELKVAITIDVLPRGGDGGQRDLASVLAMTEKLLDPFRDSGIPVIGFVQ